MNGATATAHRKFSSWFYAVARNATIDCHKRRRNKLKMLEPDLAADLADEQQTFTEPNRLEQDEAVAVLHEALRELPPLPGSGRIVAFQGMSYEEASEALGGVALAPYAVECTVA